MPSNTLSIKHPLLRLLLVSFAALYIEIILIRWVSTEVRVFAYFQNLALIACFLGFGLGCYRANRPKNLFFSLVALAALVFLVQMPYAGWKQILAMNVSSLSFSSDVVLWGWNWDVVRSIFPAGLIVFITALSLSIVALFLGLLVAVMVPLGQWVGFYLNEARNPVRAYSVNLFGSVLGVWAPVGLALLWLPPVWWFAFAAFLLIVLQPVSRSVVVLEAILAVVVIVAILYTGNDIAWQFRQVEQVGSGETHTYWSPYQKLQVVDMGDMQYLVFVNNTGYMNITNLTPRFVSQHPDLARVYEESSYDAPLRFAKRIERVLVVGAGSGNDVAAALRHGAETVDAVEIDPVIYDIGKRLHPEEPYQSDRVRVVINDARAFFRQAQEQYDVIIFGLLDSHTQFSDLSNMRIDNYVYTEEAFREARQLLKPDGILVVKFEVRSPWAWIGQRIFAMLEHTFGRPPIVFFAPGAGPMVTSGTVFVVSNDPALWDRAQSPELASLITANPPAFPTDSANAPLLTTDDWPYMYHRDRSIPRTFLTVSAILIVMAFLFVRRSFESSRRESWLFFLLGGGFLLLETQMVSRLALYFGTTWIVNSIALTGILAVLILATFFVMKRKLRTLAPFYTLLVLSLAVLYLFPWERLPYSTHTVGALLAVAYSTPLFFSGIIFIELFRRSTNKSGALGANIVGAVAGGLAQNLSFIFGMESLLIVAVLFYGVAFLLTVAKSKEFGDVALSP